MTLRGQCIPILRGIRGQVPLACVIIVECARRRLRGKRGAQTRIEELLVLSRVRRRWRRR